MAKRRSGGALENWEIAMVKAMLERGGNTDQELLAYFTRPTRSVNHRVISEIRTNTKHRAVNPSTSGELDDFLANWPDVDPQTGLSIRGDELLIKAREAMIAAVHMFNGAGLMFRAELFIVTCVIAWTYLLHSWFRSEGIDYRYKNANGDVGRTKQGADRYWELGKCLRHPRCPISKGAVNNLEFLIDLRHEIEHRSTGKIDDNISAKLQACCINFNAAIKTHFGSQFGLELRLPIALQFATFGTDQRELLKKAINLPAHIEAMMDAFHHGLTKKEHDDPNFAYRVVFRPKSSTRISSADLAVEFIKEYPSGANEKILVLHKDVDRRRFLAKEIVTLMNEEGYPGFKLQNHTELWKDLDGKNLEKGYGREGEAGGRSWVWYQTWVDRVRAHCQDYKNQYE